MGSESIGLLDHWFVKTISSFLDLVERLSIALAYTLFV
jgi:hypothetical protein